MATLKTIQKELIKLKAVYPYPDRSIDELRTLSEVWAEDFIDINDAELLAAIARHRKESEYFPTPANILKTVNLNRNEVMRKWELIPELPPILTDEQIKENKERIKKLILTLS